MGGRRWGSSQDAHLDGHWREGVHASPNFLVEQALRRSTAVHLVDYDKVLDLVRLSNSTKNDMNRHTMWGAWAPWRAHVGRDGVPGPPCILAPRTNHRPRSPASTRRWWRMHPTVGDSERRILGRHVASSWALPAMSEWLDASGLAWQRVDEGAAEWTWQRTDQDLGPEGYVLDVLRTRSR